MTSAFNKAMIVGGGFQDASGNILANGWLTFKLSHDSNVSTLGSPGGMQVVAGITVKIFLESNGFIQKGQYLWTNDQLTPVGSYYTVMAYNYQGVRVWASPQIMYIQPYATSINIGTLQPTTP